MVISKQTPLFLMVEVSKEFVDMLLKPPQFHKQNLMDLGTKKYT